MNVKQFIARTILRIEAAVDRIVRAVKRRLYRNTDVMIDAYTGFGNHNRQIVRGRVLENHTVPPATDDDNAWRNLRNVIRRFNSDELPNVPVTIRLASQQLSVMTDDEGFYRAEFTQPLESTDIWHTAHITYDDGQRTASVQGTVMVPPADARFAVVSDLDDTVIRSNVPNLVRLLFNTFFKNARTRLPFPGVAEFYRALQIGMRDTFNPIYYVSNSPYNLHDMLQDFMAHRGIPRGPIFLRDFGLTRAYLGASKRHKRQKITQLLTLYPDLPFILIGDSGEHDAEIYLQIVRDFPGRIAAIYIRDVRPGRRTKHDARVREAAAAVREAGSELLLIPDTAVAARHAVERGFIPADLLPRIEAAVKADAAANPLQALIDDVTTS